MLRFIQKFLLAKYAHFDGKLYFLKQRESCSYVKMIVPNYGCLFVAKMYFCIQWNYIYIQ